MQQGGYAISDTQGQLSGGWGGPSWGNSRVGSERTRVSSHCSQARPQFHPCQMSCSRKAVRPHGVLGCCLPSSR